MVFVPDKKDSFVPDKKDSFVPDKKDSFVPDERPKRTLAQSALRAADFPRAATFGDIPFVRKLPALADIGGPEARFDKPETKFEKGLVGTTRFVRDVATLGKLGPLKGLPLIGAGAAFGAATADSEDPKEILKQAATTGAMFGAIQALPPAIKGVVKGADKLGMKVAPGATTAFKEGLKSVGKRIALSLPKFTPITKLNMFRRGQVNAKKAEGAALVKTLRDNYTPAQRKALYFLRTKQPVPRMLKDKEVLTVLRDKKQREALKPIAEKVGKFFDDFEGNFINVYGDDAKFIEQYLPQAYKGFKDRAQIAKLSRFIVNAKNLKQRKLTLDKAVNSLGLEPNLDVADLTAFYTASTPEALYNLEFLKQIKGGKAPDGKKFFVGMKAGQKAGLREQGWKTIDHPLLRKGLGVKTKGGKLLIREEPVFVHPEIADEINTIFSVKSENALLRGVERINRLAKFSQLALSGFHGIAVTESSIATGSFSPKLLAKTIRDMKAGKPPVLNNPAAQDWLKNNLILGGSEAEIFEEVSEALLKTGRSRLVNAGKKILQKPIALNNKFLFQYYIPNLKIAAADKLYADALKMPQFRGMPEAVIKPKVAQLVNDFFGGQDMQLLLQSPRAQQMAHLALLSPDWFMSTMRQALAPFGVGGRSKVENVLREELGKNFWKQGAVTLFIGVNQMNRLFTKFHYGQPRNMWENAPGKKTNLFLGVDSKGKEKYLRWGKQFRELPEWFINPLQKLKGKQAPTLRAAIEQFYPFAFGEIAKTTGMRRVGARVKEAGRTFLPFSVQNVMRSGEFSPLQLAFPVSDGMKYYNTLQMFKDAVRSNNSNRIREIHQSALQNNLDANNILNRAISSVELEQAGGFKKAQQIFNDIRKQPEDRWPSLISSMDIDNRTRKILKRLIKEHFRIKAQIANPQAINKSLQKLQRIQK